MAIPHLVVGGTLLVAASLAVATFGSAPTAPAPTDAQATVASTGTIPSDPAPPSRYTWPTGGPVEVLRAFDGPSVPWAVGHRGVDLALEPGAPVVAAADGVVVFAGVVVDRSVVSVSHSDGIRTTYEPVDPVVTEGQRVAKGDVLGHLAPIPAHCPQGCLHWGARRGSDDYLDPLTLLRARVIRLYASAPPPAHSGPPR